MINYIKYYLIEKGVFKFSYLKYIEEEHFIEARQNIQDLKTQYLSFQTDKIENFENFTPKKSYFL